MARTLGKRTHAEKRPNVLPSFTLEAVADRIKRGQAENIIVMSGAGISTCEEDKYAFVCVNMPLSAAGIPDFRSDQGLYAKLAEHGLKNPESIFEINTFMENPKV